MKAKFIGFDGFEKEMNISPVTYGDGRPTLPREWRIPMFQMHCSRHPIAFMSLTLQETIEKQKACCYNDAFGIPRTRVFRLQPPKTYPDEVARALSSLVGDEMPVYKEDTRY